MEYIFHEKQEGSLCAQHCLNALLQNEYFSAVDLAQIGGRLDESERVRMAEGGVATHEYQQFIEQPSNNFDDSGFFSVQVISEALSVWSLDMVLYNSSNAIAVQAREDPTQMSAFICNYHQHWFSVRKLGEQWFNLNSLLSGPELISNTYLSLFLTQLQQEGYSIFIITGSLPSCEADQLLRLMPAVQTVKPRLLSEIKDKEKQPDPADDEEDLVLREALEASRSMIESDDSALQHALRMSLEGYESSSASFNNSLPQSSAEKVPKHEKTEEQRSSENDAATPSKDELRQKRLAFLDKQSSSSASAQSNNSNDKSATDLETQTTTESNEVSDEELLQRAIELSMEKNNSNPK